MPQPPRVLPPGYQPFTDEQRRRRGAYAGGDRSPENREAAADYAASRKRHPDVVIPKLEPLPLKGEAETVDVVIPDEAPIVHGTPAGAGRGCKGTNCDNHGSADHMTCEQALIRYRGDYAYRKAVDAGSATTLKAGHDDADVQTTVKGAYVSTHPKVKTATVADRFEAHEKPRPGKPKTTAPDPTSVDPAYFEVTPDEDTSAVADLVAAQPNVAAGIVDAELLVDFALEEPPIGEPDPGDQADPLAALQLQYERTRLDLIHAEQALREEKAAHRHRYDELAESADRCVAELTSTREQLTTSLEMAHTAELARQRQALDHAAYLALAAVPDRPTEVWIRALIHDPHAPRTREPRTIRHRASTLRRTR